MKRHVIMRCVVGLSGLAVLPGRSLARAGTSIHVCVGADLVLRFAPRGTPCPQNQVGYDLSLDVKEPKAPKEDEPPPKEVVGLQKTVEFLRTRVSNLEKELANEADAKDHLSHKVVAPFVVVDHSGKAIFRVRDDLHGFEMANAAGQTVLWASALDNGGVFKTRSAGSFPEVVMGSVGNFGGFAIRDGENLDRASLTLSGGKPSFDLKNDSHVDIVSLHQAPAGGGFLQLGVASGESAVQAGVTSGGKCGRVDAYPLTPSGRTLVGAPASFIMGKC